MMSDSDRNAILQTVILNLEDGKKGAPASFTDEEKEYYLALEKDILADMAAGRKPNYSISYSNDW